MATIRISTNTDPSQDVLMLPQGHPMVPSLGVLNLAYSPYGTMLDREDQILDYKGHFTIKHAGFYGVYGPGWAARMDVDPTFLGQTMTVNVTNDVLMAGIQWGASHAFYVSFVGKSWEFDHWEWAGFVPYPVFEWHKTDDINFVIPLDFIKIIYYAILVIQGIKDYFNPPPGSTLADEIALQGKRQEFETIQGLAWATPADLQMKDPGQLPIAEIPAHQMIMPTLWGLVDEAQGTFNKSGWSAEYVFPVGVKNFHNGDYMQMKAYPGLVQAIDIYRLLVNWDRNVHQFTGSLYLFDRVIRGLHCDVSLGVTVGVVFPFQVSLKNIQLNGPSDKSVYGDFTFNSSNNTVTGTRKDPAPSMPTYNSAALTSTFLMYFTFNTGIDFRFGVFGSATFFSVLSLSFAVDWNVLEDWFHLSWQTREEGVKIGGTPSSSSASSARSTVDMTDEIEVVFA